MSANSPMTPARQQPLIPSSAPAGEVVEAIRAGNPSVPCTPAEDLSAALELARRRVRRILITGSLFLVGEAITVLEGSLAAPEFTAQ